MAPISVLIVSYRTPELTEAAAASALRIPLVKEVIVVDNASGDDTVQRLSGLQDDRLRVLVNRTNVGFGTAANRAAADASGDVLLFLNSDAELSLDAASTLWQAMSSGGRSIAGPKLISPDGTVQRSAGLLPGPLDLTLRGLGLHRVAAATMGWRLVGPPIRRSRLAREYESAVEADVPISTSMVSGACYVIGRQAFAELGGYDERFFMYFEDADLCRRALGAGMRISYVPSAIVTHVWGASSSDDYHFGPAHTRSMRQYLTKWYGQPGAALAILIAWLRLIGFAVTARRATGRAFRALVAALGRGGAQ
jgi:N-acetylglucosaminyl-diphospho-decaprenol L-rhamnosyltransferase